MGCRLPDFRAPCRVLPVAFQPRRWWQRLEFRRRPSCQYIVIDQPESKSVLDCAHLRKEYFHDEGRTFISPPFFYPYAYGIHFYIPPDKLLRITEIYPSSIWRALVNYKIFLKEEIAPASDRPSSFKFRSGAWTASVIEARFEGLSVDEEYMEYILTHHDQWFKGFFPSGQFTRQSSYNLP